MLRSFAFALACSLLAGCVGAPPKPAVISKPVVVKVAVPVPCIDKIPDAPVLESDRDLLAGSGAQVFDKVWADHLSRRDYQGVLLAALKACLAPPTAPHH